MKKKFFLISLLLSCRLVSAETLHLNLTSPAPAIQAGCQIAQDTRFSGNGMDCTGIPGKTIRFLSIPGKGLLNPEEGSIELVFSHEWSKTPSNINCIFNSGVGVMWGQKNTLHIQREGNNLRFIMIDDTGKILAAEARGFVHRFADGKPHHVAAMWKKEEGLLIHVDGLLEGVCRNRFEFKPQNSSLFIGTNNIYPGGEKYYYPGNAIIHSVVISDKVWDKFALPVAEQVRTHVYPAEHGRKGVAALMKGIPVHLLVYYYGNKTGLTQARLIIDVPEKILIVGMGQTLINKVFPSKPNVTSEPVMRNGRKYFRYFIPIEGIESLSGTIDRAFNHMIYLEPEMDMLPGDYPLFYHVEVNGQNGREKQLSATVLPRFQPITLPKDFQVSLFFAGSLTKPHGGGHLMYHPEDEGSVGKKLRTLFRNLGISEGRIPGNGSMGNFIAEHADWLVYSNWGNFGQPRIGADGKPIPGRSCPTLIGREGFELSKALIASLKKEYAQHQTRFVMPDYEWERPAFQCFCDTCKKEFSQFAGVDATHLSGNQILERYNEKWGEFLCLQNGKIVEQVTKIIRAAAPDAKIYFCANYVFDRSYMLKVGHDVRRFDPFVDAHMPMIYYGGKDFFDKIERTCSELKKPVIPYLCVNDVPYNPMIFLTPQAMRMNILATFACGGKGVAFYPGADSFDGEYYAELNRTFGEIAECEKYRTGAIIKDKIVSVSPNLPYKVWESKDTRFIMIFNYGKTKVAFRIETVLENASEWFAFLPSEKKNLNLKRLNGKIEAFSSINPEDVSFIVLTKNHSRKIADDFRDSSADEKNFFAGHPLPEKIHNTELFHMNGNMLELNLGNNGVFLVDLEKGGRIKQWIHNGEKLISGKSSSDAFFHDLFYPSPAWGAEPEYAIVTEQTATDDKVSLKLAVPLPLKGLALVKRYEFSRNQPTFSVKYEFRNIGPEKITFIPWFHNVPFNEGWKLRFIESIPTGTGDNLFFRVGETPSDSWEKKANTGFYTGNSAVIESHSGNTVRFEFVPEQVRAIYVWNGATLEFFGEKTVLMPERKMNFFFRVAMGIPMRR